MDGTADRRNRRGGQGAFTLVEAAIVLLIMGILAAFLVPTVFTGSQAEHRAAAREEVLALKDQVFGYFLSPPAEDKAAATDMVFLPGQGYVAGRVDFWGRPLRYVAAPELTSNGLTRYQFCRRKTTSLAVKTASGLVRNVAFVVGSQGPEQDANIDFAANPVDLTSASDDIAEYATMIELVGVACRGY